jgi:CBS domain containing-hemolysin-like protein
MNPVQAIGTAHRPRRAAVGRVLGLLLAILTLPSTAHASLFPPEVEDKLATIIAVVVIFLVPVVLIVHVLPEKIAHKRHHPQFEAIRTLCLLSLVFGGLLWPFAWIWAYSKPVFHKMAYGTDKEHAHEHEVYDDEEEKAVASMALSDRLARLEQQGLPAAEVTALRRDLDALEARLNHKVREAR